MKSFKSYMSEAVPVQQNPTPIAYGSIGNRADLALPSVQTATSVPVVFASIGNRPDPMDMTHASTLHQQVVKMLSGRYKHGHNTLPHKTQMREYYEHGIPLSKEQAGHPLPHTDVMYDFGSPERQEMDNNVAELENHHGHNDYNVRNAKKTHPAVWHYVGGSSHLNGALIHTHVAGEDAHNVEHLTRGLVNHYHQTHATPDVHAEATETGKTLHGVVKGLDEVIKNSKPMHKEMHVFTGIGSKLNIQDLRAAGHTKVHMPAFTSTSIDPGVASGFAHKGKKSHREMIRIHLPEGSKHGTWLGSAGLQNEHEMLLKRGTTLKFHGEPHVVDSYDGRMMIHHATIEDHDEDKK